MAALLRWFFGMFERCDYTGYRKINHKTKYAVKGRKKKSR